MEYAIGIYGSAGDEPKETFDRAERLGRAVARAGCSVITGACSDLPYAAAKAASREGARVIGYSPMRDEEGQRAFTPDDDLTVYSDIQMLPEGFPDAGNVAVAKKYRNVLSTSQCDAGLIVAGRWGTLHEACSLIDFGKVVGLLQGSGGIADMLPELAGLIGSSENIVADTDPDRLVRRILERLGTR